MTPAHDDTDIALILGEVKGELKALVESLDGLRVQVDSIADSLDARLHAVDERLRPVERDTFLLTRVGGFFVGCLTIAFGWIIGQLA